MATAKKAITKEKDHSDVIVSDKVRSYADEPYFVQKAEKAKEFLSKHPIPDHLKK
jgi:hypothetical protein